MKFIKVEVMNPQVFIDFLELLRHFLGRKIKTCVFLSLGIKMILLQSYFLWLRKQECSSSVTNSVLCKSNDNSGVNILCFQSISKWDLTIRRKPFGTMSLCPSWPRRKKTSLSSTITCWTSSERERSTRGWVVKGWGLLFFFFTSTFSDL